jgi:hypothetical protein
MAKKNIKQSTEGPKKEGFLRRYTDLTSLIHILSTGNLTLLDPEDWEDRNDAHFMDSYKAHKNLETLLALCFTQASETYHHWYVFANDPSGVCIEFNKKELIAVFKKQKSINFGEVKYFRIQDLAKVRNIKDKLPFIKRLPYGDENEFRVIYQNKTKKHATYEIPLNSKCIRRITLSPWLNEVQRDAVKKTLNAINCFTDFKICGSSLLDNKSWKAYAQ